MHKHYQNLKKHAHLLGAIYVSLLVMPAIAMPRMETGKLLSQANPNPGTGISSPSLNPIPSIFNQPPYNRRSRSTPTTPNTPTQPSSVIQPPLPEQQQAPSAMVTPANGQVSIRLVNETGANINYQVIGNTNQRSLQGKSNVVLKDLPIPVTVTFKRQDGGLLQVSPQASSEPAMLEVTFTETTELSIDKSTLRVQRTGAVLLN